MTKEELTKIIEKSVKEHDFDFKDYDREDYYNELAKRT